MLPAVSTHSILVHAAPVDAQDRRLLRVGPVLRVDLVAAAVAVDRRRDARLRPDELVSDLAQRPGVLVGAVGVDREAWNGLERVGRPARRLRAGDDDLERCGVGMRAAPTAVAVAPARAGPHRLACGCRGAREDAQPGRGGEAGEGIARAVQASTLAVEVGERVVRGDHADDDLPASVERKHGEGVRRVTAGLHLQRDALVADRDDDDARTRGGRADERRDSPGAVLVVREVRFGRRQPRRVDGRRSGPVDLDVDAQSRGDDDARAGRRLRRPLGVGRIARPRARQKDERQHPRISRGHRSSSRSRSSITPTCFTRPRSRTTRRSPRACASSR